MRKFLTQAFKHGIEDQYKKLHGTNCSRSLSYCRDLCFLPHLLRVKTSWKDITVQEFSVAFNIDASLLMNDDQRILSLLDIQNPLFLSTSFWDSCAQLIDHRLSIRQNLFVGIKQVSTWNVGGGSYSQAEYVQTACIQKTWIAGNFVSSRNKMVSVW